MTNHRSMYPRCQLVVGKALRANAAQSSNLGATYTGVFITWILEKISRLTNGVEKAPNRLLWIENETTSQDLQENRYPEA